jgi:uncharacterized protein (DUF1800 family)
MADRQPPRPVGHTSSDAPLVDLIFPNRHGGDTGHIPRQHRSDAGLDAWRVDAQRSKQPANSHRRSSRLRTLSDLLRRRTKVVHVASGRTRRRGLIANLPIARRRLLLGIGTGAAVAAGAGTAATFITNAFSPGDSARRPSTIDGLGAAGLADSPAVAARIAAEATPTWPTPLARDPELHLLRRATFGPTLVDVVAARQMGIDAWLERQLNPAGITDPIGDQISMWYPTIGMSTAQIRAALEANSGQAMTELGRGTLARQMWSTRQLYEVMVDFWSNHLNVTNPFDGGWDVRTPYDHIIRAHALGRFSDMLHASARHPAMMRYLDNNRSNKRNVNENYGRELLELHTVGLESGYTEVDVRQSAYIMTGRTVDNNGNFVYNAGIHFTGPVKVLDFDHPNGSAAEGLALGDQYVYYLATHPATAKRIAHKLGRRFVCDDPPQTLVDRLAQSYLDNGTAIVPVLRTLFSSVEFWMSTGLKVRTPLENVLATTRIVGVTPGASTTEGLNGLYRLTDNLGQAPLTWGPPDGFPDYADAWGSAHATLGTWNSHRSMTAGSANGLTYAKAETFVGLQPATVGEYLETISLRLVHQPMQPEHKAALLTFLGAEDATAVKDLRLGGKIDTLVPLILDSVYHALR